MQLLHMRMQCCLHTSNLGTQCADFVATIWHVSFDRSHLGLKDVLHAVPLVPIFGEDVLQFQLLPLYLPNRREQARSISFLTRLHIHDLIAEGIEISDEGGSLLPNEPQLCLVQLHLLLIQRLNLPLPISLPASSLCTFPDHLSSRARWAETPAPPSLHRGHRGREVHASDRQELTCKQVRSQVRSEHTF